jgi:ATP-dependent helicase Lhr and Lhr-like helicase
MGAIDLVVQIEAPPVGRQRPAAHRPRRPPRRRGQRGSSSSRSSAATCWPARRSRARCTRGEVERRATRATRSTCSRSRSWRWWRWSRLGRRRALRRRPRRRAVRRPEPPVFDGVLDMLSGRYPSDEFAELRPRSPGTGKNGTLTARQGAKRVAIANAGTIPDRGLYGVFLAGRRAARRASASSTRRWCSRRASARRSCSAPRRGASRRSPTTACSSRPRRASPARCRSGRATGPGRPIELGLAIGALARARAAEPRAGALARWSRDHDLDARAAENLLQYLDDQQEAAGAVPDDRTMLIERCRDELGDWRVCVLSPFGGRVHAPWAMAVTARLRDERGLDVETMWSDDGFVVRLPEATRRRPRADAARPRRGRGLVVRSSDRPRCSPRGSARTRRARCCCRAGGPAARAALAAAQARGRPAGRRARFGSFPIILETYRECLRDVFDLPGARGRAARASAAARSAWRRSTRTPVAVCRVAALRLRRQLPLRRRRAAGRAPRAGAVVDQSQLRELLGEAELRELLDADALERSSATQHCLPRYHARSPTACTTCCCASATSRATSWPRGPCPGWPAQR